MTRSATSSLSRNVPDCQRSESTSVVLPWSTWATMATLRRWGIGPGGETAKVPLAGALRQPGAVRSGAKTDVARAVP